ncbi:hypothetical protein THRCLA_03392 [Thraustotheca clavata]|uniref:RING-type domain-containing protein n=1 Tax=Thraustotheca clavata TaxID=74557 RepID=A0A1W0A260_9STRA|nr:hypothetical protein THRCLA_03392 [Thraustotheca clavata]
MQMEERKATTPPAYYQYQQLQRRQTCPICGSQTVPPNVVLEPCQHQFHLHCVDGYVQNEKSCPVCRAPIQRVNRSFIAGQQHEYMHAPSPSQSQMHRQQQYNPQIQQSNYPSASVYELPPEVFLDTSYEQQGGMAPGKMRKGKWTAEEAQYCDRLIEEFKLGNLPLAEGTTLRTFLSKLLNCDPMRISKKYTGNQCIGKIIFRKKAKEPTKEEVETTRKQLADLERVYLERERMNQQRREKRLETELTRDRGRLLASRHMYHGMPGQAQPPPTMMNDPRQVPPPGASYHHSHQPPHTMQHHAQMQHMQQSYHDIEVKQQQQMQQQQQQSMQQRQPSPPVQTNAPQTQVQKQQNPSPPQAPIKNEQPPAEVKSETIENKTNEESRGDPMLRVSSIDSFSSIFPRIASLDCFQGLQSISRNPSSMSLHDSSNMFRSPSLECFNGIPRVNSLEQFSNFIASMPPHEVKKESDNNFNDGKNQGSSPPTLPKATSSKPPMSGPGIARAASSDKLHQMTTLPRVPSLDKALDKIPRVTSMDRLQGGGIPRVPSLGNGLSRIASTEAFLHQIPSLSNLSGLMPSFGSFDKLSSLSKEKHQQLAIPRNSSLEDILSLVASADNENRPDLKSLKRKAEDGITTSGIHNKNKSSEPLASTLSSSSSSILPEKKQRL